MRQARITSLRFWVYALRLTDQLINPILRKGCVYGLPNVRSLWSSGITVVFGDDEFWRVNE